MGEKDVKNVRWRKSSHSGNGGDTCVELAALTEGTGVRDSVSPQSGHLTLTPDRFAALVREIKAGQHDL
jgi:hypothetical protein